ncbi:hypothetical protein Bca4012_084600 [Brassica carinata]
MFKNGIPWLEKHFAGQRSSGDKIRENLLSTDASRWIRNKVEEVFPEVANLILRLVPSLMGAEDMYCWYGTKSGIYSVKSGGALSLGANLATRGLSADIACPHCGDTETALHLFFHCHFTIQVWTLAPLNRPLRVSSCSSLAAAIQEASLLVCLPPTGLVGNFSSWIFWFLWTSRNKLVFENRHISAGSTISSAITSTVVCNTDAAWSCESSIAGLGWIYNLSDLNKQEALSKCSRNVSSPLMAEALAMREAIISAKHRLLYKVWFQSDSQELIRAINSKSYPMELYGVLSDIELLSSFFVFISFSFIPRAQNMLADSVAKNAMCDAPATLF